MKWLKQLIPPSLQKFDNYLLINKPWFWNIRLHYHTWFLLLINLILVLFGLFFPLDITDVLKLEKVFGYMIIFQVIYFCFWVYKQVLFNVTKRFGKTFFYQVVAEFWLYTFSLLLIVSISYTPSFIINYRIANLVENSELIADYNVLAKSDIYADSQGSYRYFRNKQEYIKAYKSKNHDGHDYYVDNRLIELDQYFHSRQDDYRHFMQDSFLHKDTLSLIEYELDSIVQNYQEYFTSIDQKSVDSSYTYTLDLWTEQQLKSHYLAMLDQPKEFHLKLLEEKRRVSNKYGLDLPYSNETYYSFFKKMNGVSKSYRARLDLYRHHFKKDESQQAPEYYYDDYYSDYNYRYNIVARNMRRIYDSKTYDLFFFKSYAPLVLLFIAMAIATVLIIFKMSDWRNFILTIVGIGVIAGLLGIFVSFRNVIFSEYYNEERMFAVGFCSITLAFVIVLIIRSKRLVYSRVLSSMNLALMAALPFILIVAFATADNKYDFFNKDEFSDKIYQLNYEYDNGRITTEAYDLKIKELRRLDDQRDNHIKIIYTGVFTLNLLLFIFLFMPLLKRNADRLNSYPRKS